MGFEFADVQGNDLRVVGYDSLMRVAVLGQGVLGETLLDYSAEFPIELMVFPTDITNASALMRELGEYQPDVVINTAAKTGVDWCETHPVEALRVNAIGAGTAAYVSAGVGAHFVHISTDYVFSGYSRDGQGYEAGDTMEPINVYGASKMLGERAVSALGSERATIVRIGWLYGAKYPKCAPMLAKNTYRETVRGVETVHRAYIFDDMWGTPTFVGDVAAILLGNIAGPLTFVRARSRLAAAHRNGPERLGLTQDSMVVHLAPEQPPVSWYEFLEGKYADVRPTPSSKVPLKARRPKYGGLKPTPGWTIYGDWDEHLDRFEREYVWHRDKRT